MVVVGEALVDLVTTAAGETRGHPGGSPANTALGLARLGVPVTLLTGLGQDEHGALIERHLAAGGVRVVNRADPARGRPTSTAAVAIDPAGRPSYDFAVSWEIDPLEPPRVGTAAVHTGSLGAALAPGRDHVEAFLAAARRHATVSYDPNIRPALLADPATERARVERQLRDCDLVKASTEDLAWLYPGADPIAIAAAWLRLGPALVAVTDGEHGAAALTATAMVRRAAHPVAVADTVGAGDAFTAGLLFGLAQANLLGADRRAELAAIGEPGFGDVLAIAVLAAGLTCARPGADPPHRAELHAALAGI